MADWPAWATARVEVRPADLQWQRLGAALRCELDLVLARWLVAPVEHVGSTAVPGLAAKPVLDLQAAVADLGCVPAVAEAVAGGSSCLRSSTSGRGAGSWSRSSTMRGWRTCTCWS